jgi:hypothetical protein
MKWPKRIALALAGLLVVAVLIANVYLGDAAKAVIEKVGPLLVGVSVKLDSVQFRLLRGVIHIDGLVLGNPEGFKTDKAIGVRKIAVDVDMRSLLRDTVHFRRILISEPEIVYETGLRTSNIGRIRDGMGESSGGKVVIDDLLIQRAKVRVSVKLAQGAAAPLPLPDIHMTDIGKEEQGISQDEVVRRVLEVLMSAMGKVVTGSAEKGGRVAGGAVKKGASKVVGSVKRFFGGGKTTNRNSTVSGKPL